MSAVKVVMVDNYDSFTYNLVQYFGELGADVTVVRNDQVTVADIEKLAPDKIVISPGPCTPKEAGVSVEAIRSSPANTRFWASAWATRASAMPSAAISSMPRASCTAKLRRFTITMSASSRAEQPLYRDPLSFTGDRAGDLARLPGNHRLDPGRSRQHR